MNPQDFSATAGPTKVQRLLDSATERGLSVTYDGKPNDDLTRSYAWTIKSGAEHDRDALWLFWHPGPNGGSLAIDYYRPERAAGKSNIERVTRRQAHQQMQWMRETLERHQEREAARAEVEAHNNAHPDGPGCTVEHPELTPAGRSLPCVLRGPHAVHQDSVTRKWTVGVPAPGVAQQSQERRPEMIKPAVVTNASDLSPGMKMTLLRDTPHSPRLTTRTTVNALEARGLAVSMGDGWCALTDQGRKVRAALEGYARVLGPVAPDEHLAACGCPERTIQEEGHREGCTLHGADLARLAQIRADAEAAGNEALAVQITRERIAMAKNAPASPWQYPANPQDPNWLRADQVIHRAGEILTVVAVIIHQGVLRSVAVSVNGGYGGKLRWYGDYAEPTTGPVSMLFDDECGLPADERRPWPRSLVSAHDTVRRVLHEQRLDGWAAGKVYEDESQPGYIVVEVPALQNPARHLALLERYVPYVCNVRSLGDSEGWTEIAIEPTDTPED